MILASLAMGAFAATAADNNSAIYFNTTQPVNDLQGGLAAEVKFAQSQIVSAHPKEGERCPPGFIAAACGGWKRAEMMKGRNVWELRIPPVLPPPGIHLPEGCFRRNNSSSSSGRP